MRKKKSLAVLEPESYHVEVITKARVVAPSSSSEDEVEDDAEYDGEGIWSGKKKKKSKKKKEALKAEWEYFVKWAGYDSDANSWEPSANVAGCQRLLASFWNHIGTDDSDYAVGYIVEASDKWIRREKKFFAREFSSAQEEARRKREIEELDYVPKKSVTKKARRRESTIEEWSPVPSSSKVQLKRKGASYEDIDDVPLMIRLPPKRKRLARASSSDDEIPFEVSEVLEPPPRKIARTDTSNRSYDKGKQKATEPQSDFSSPTSLFSVHSSPAASPASPPPPIVPAKKWPLPPPTLKPTPTIPGKTTPTIVSKAAPAIPRRPANPYLMPPGDSISSSSSTLTTKQRLSQGALAPTAPTKPPLRKPPPPVKAAANASGSASGPLINLSFKKKPPVSVLPGPLPPQHPPPQQQSLDPTLAELNAPEASAPSPSVSLFSDMLPPPLAMSSPQEFAVHEPFDPFVANGILSPQVFHQAPRDVIMTQAEDFLQSIMPSALSAPIVLAAEKPFEPVPSHPLLSSKPILPTWIPKQKWTWTGEVIMDVVGGKTEPLCNATLCDLTDPVPTGLRYNIAMASMSQLHFLSFHDAVDMDALLSACKPAQQLARLGPKEEKDVAPFMTLVQYMGKRQQVTLVPVSLDDNVIGHILLFPHANGDLCRRFKVPGEMQTAGCLVAALVPWALGPAQLAKESRKPPSTRLPADTDLEPAIADTSRWENTIRTQPLYQHALRVLRFPQWLHTFMAEEGHDRAFCVWWEGGDGTRKEPGLETKLLLAVMEQCRARNAGHKADVRVVFVHVGALKTLHKLPALVERRAKTPQVQFYTYGTHESVPPEDWGMQEIYPCGGVVTFTPNALIDDPIEVLHRIKQIDQHPLWACYILPSVLGMTAKLISKDQDPLELFDSGAFPYGDFLSAIEDGEAALIRAPPHDRSPLASKDPRHEWIREHWVRHPADARGILEAGASAFSRTYSNVQEAEWAARMDAEIAVDMASMQRHRAIMDQYRRYVVVRSERDVDHAAGNKDGLEWVTAAKFDFRDDFYSHKA